MRFLYLVGMFSWVGVFGLTLTEPIVTHPRITMPVLLSVIFTIVYAGLFGIKFQGGGFLLVSHFIPWASDRYLKVRVVYSTIIYVRQSHWALGSVYLCGFPVHYIALNRPHDSPFPGFHVYSRYWTHTADICVSGMVGSIITGSTRQEISYIFGCE